MSDLTYAYRCVECAKVFTIAETLTAHLKRKVDPVCPSCGSPVTVRQLEPVDVVLVGDGWWRDGYQGHGK